MRLTPGTWTADRDVTKVSFTVPHLAVKAVRGTFDVLAGHVRTDESGRPRQVKAALASGTFHTGHAKRDSDICSKRFLDAERNPEITYLCTDIVETETGWLASGRLTLGDRSAPLDLEVTLADAAESRLDVVARGTVDRAALGIRAPGFLIGRRVEVTVSIGSGHPRRERSA
jgi:polyisoprenoid-binding protein YceI